MKQMDACARAGPTFVLIKPMSEKQTKEIATVMEAQANGEKDGAKRRKKAGGANVLIVTHAVIFSETEVEINTASHESTNIVYKT